MAATFHAKGSGGQNTAVASFNITCTISAGDGVVVFGSWDSASTTTPTVVTTGGTGSDSFSLVYGPFTSGTFKYGGWLLASAGTGRTGATMSWASSTPAFADAGCESFSGLSNPTLDKVAFATGTATNATSGNTPTLSSNDEFAVGYCASTLNVTGSNAPWTDDGIIAINSSWIQHRVLAATTAINSNFQSNGTWITFCLTFQAGTTTAPFYKSDWGAQKDLVGLSPQAAQTNINLYTNPIPFVSTDRPQTVRVPLVGPPQLLPLNINLFTNPQPFRQTDWPTARPPQDFLVPAQPYNAALYIVTVAAAPFYQNDWSVTKFLKPRAPDATQQTNVNLFTNPIPFSQTDWSSTKFSTPRAPDQLAYNQSLYTVTVVASPFYQTDWPKAQLLKSAPTQIYPNIALLNPVVVAAPFVPTDWQIQRRLQPQVPWSAPNLPLLNFLSTPSAQIDWSTSRRLPSAPVSGSVGFQILNAMVSSTADLAVTEANDTLVADGTVAVAASASLVEANDTLASTAALAIVASSALTEAADTLSATGLNGGINADLSVTEANDTLSAAGTVSGVVESGGGYKYGWKPWRPSRKKRIEEELEELEELLRAAAEAAPKTISKVSPPIVYQGPLSAIFYEPIELRTTPTVNEIMARARAEAQLREDDDEEALLMLLI